MKRTKTAKNKFMALTSVGMDGYEGRVVWQVIIKLLFLSAASFGTCLTFAETYGIPAAPSDIAVFTVPVTIILSALFIFVRLRYALPLIVLTGGFLLKDIDFFSYANNFINYFLYRLDGRLLYTSKFATVSFDALSKDRLINAVFFIFFLISLIYAISSRARFVGTILITAIIMLLPAFISETALFSPGYYPLIISMAGLYGMWVSHELALSPRIMPKSTGKGKILTAGFPPIIGYGFHGILLAVSAAVLVAAFDFLLEDGDKGINGLIMNLQRDILSAADYLPSYLNYQANVEHNGYFSDNALNEDSNFIHLNAPNTSTRPVLKVTKGDNSEPLFLRGSICLDYNSGASGWTVNNKSRELKDLEKLIEVYYPEIEYMIYAQKISPLLVGNYTDFIGIDDVYIEYLLNTKVVFSPPALYLPAYKDNTEITYKLDTVLRSRRLMRQDFFSTFYVKKSSANFGELLGITQRLIESEESTPDNEALLIKYNDFQLRLPFDNYTVTPAEYIQYKKEYKDLIEKLYTGTSPQEHENITRLKKEIYNNSVLRAKSDNEQQASYDYVNFLTEYFRSGRYQYSLTTDNLSGENTMLGNFLFDTRSGHCALYATALTLLLREEGIPARYVTGYVINGGGVPIDGKYQYSVLERDLHAWVEVYFDGLGWVAFDPTPPINELVYIEAEGETASQADTLPPDETESAEVPPEQTQTDPPEETEALPEETEQTPQPSPRESGINLLLIVIGLLVLVITGSTIYIIAKLRKEERLLIEFSAISTEGAAKKASNFIMHLWKRKRLTVKAGELPKSFAERVDAEITLYGAPKAADVIDIIEKLEFSREGLTGAEYASLTQYVTILHAYIIQTKNPISRLIKRISLMH